MTIAVRARQCRTLLKLIFLSSRLVGFWLVLLAFCYITALLAALTNENFPAQIAMGLAAFTGFFVLLIMIEIGLGLSSRKNYLLLPGIKPAFLSVALLIGMLLTVMIVMPLGRGSSIVNLIKLNNAVVAAYSIWLIATLSLNRWLPGISGALIFLAYFFLQSIGMHQIKNEFVLRQPLGVWMLLVAALWCWLFWWFPRSKSLGRINVELVFTPIKNFMGFGVQFSRAKVDTFMGTLLLGNGDHWSGLLKNILGLILAIWVTAYLWGIVVNGDWLLVPQLEPWWILGCALIYLIVMSESSRLLKGLYRAWFLFPINRMTLLRKVEGLFWRRCAQTTIVYLVLSAMLAFSHDTSGQLFNVVVVALVAVVMLALDFYIALLLYQKYSGKTDGHVRNLQLIIQFIQIISVSVLLVVPFGSEWQPGWKLWTYIFGSIAVAFGLRQWVKGLWPRINFYRITS